MRADPSNIAPRTPRISEQPSSYPPDHPDQGPARVKPLGPDDLLASPTLSRGRRLRETLFLGAGVLAWLNIRYPMQMAHVEHGEMTHEAHGEHADMAHEAHDEHH